MAKCRASGDAAASASPRGWSAALVRSRASSSSATLARAYAARLARASTALSSGRATAAAAPWGWLVIGASVPAAGAGRPAYPFQTTGPGSLVPLAPPPTEVRGGMTPRGAVSGGVTGGEQRPQPLQPPRRRDEARADSSRKLQPKAPAEIPLCVFHTVFASIGWARRLGGEGPCTPIDMPSSTGSVAFTVGVRGMQYAPTSLHVSLP